MFSGKNRAERTAAQAWDYLSSAMASAGDSARDVGKHTAGAATAKASELADKAGKTKSKLADKATTKVNSVADEAWSRANAAANALAGRKPPLPWGLLAAFALIGAALGWAAATTARAALERKAENEELELAETAVVVTPTYDS
jgi:hypothetical protein